MNEYPYIDKCDFKELTKMGTVFFWSSLFVRDGKFNEGRKAGHVGFRFSSLHCITN